MSPGSPEPDRGAPLLSGSLHVRDRDTPLCGRPAEAGDRGEGPVPSVALTVGICRPLCARLHSNFNDLTSSLVNM